VFKKPVACEKKALQAEINRVLAGDVEEKKKKALEIGLPSTTSFTERDEMHSYYKMNCACTIIYSSSRSSSRIEYSVQF
jgi:hypothetical protein